MVPYWESTQTASRDYRTWIQVGDSFGIVRTKAVFVGINGPQPNDDVEFVRRSGVRSSHVAA